MYGKQSFVFIWSTSAGRLIECDSKKNDIRAILILSKKTLMATSDLVLAGLQGRILSIDNTAHKCMTEHCAGTYD